MSNAQTPTLPQGEIDVFFKNLKDSKLGVDEVREIVTAHKWLVNHRDPNTMATPVVYAARQGDFDIVRLLHENGADLYATDRGDQGALYYAAHEGRFDVAEYLVSQGVDPSAPNSAGISPAAAARANDFPSFGDTLERWGHEYRQRLIEQELEKDRTAREAYEANLRDVTQTMRGGVGKRVTAPKTARFGAQKS